MIRVDGTPVTALAYCTDCPPWRELRGDRAAALTAAAAHAERTHGDATRAAALRELARRNATRHADTSKQ